MKTRPITTSDYSDILRLNEESVHYLSPLTLQGLERLHRQAAIHLVVEEEGKVQGFILALRTREDYSSVNYKWFTDRYDSFLYIDRIAVSDKGRSKGAGSILYREAFQFARKHSLNLVCCEYDVQPPNPKSAAFHAKFGFTEIARQAVANGTKVVSLQIANMPFNNEATQETLRK
jgi:predicted GNAT superfamily acetyltransferase